MKRSLRRAALPNLVILALFLAAPLTTRDANAQDRPDIAVIVIDGVGFADDQLFELTYGVEQIVSDFDEFDVVGGMALSDLLSSSDRSQLEGCGIDPQCYAEILVPVDIPYAVVLEAEAIDDGYTAYITTLALDNEQIVGEQQGNFPDPGDSLFLLAPMFEAMSPLVDTGGDDRDRDRDADRDRDRDRDRDADRDRDRDRDRDPDTEPGMPPHQDESETNILAASLIGGGAAVTVTGLVFWILADGTLEDIQSEPHDRAALLDLQDTGSGQQTIGNALFVTGVVVLAAGVIFQLTGIGEPKDDEFDFDDDWVRLDIRGGRTPTVGFEVDF